MKFFNTEGPIITQDHYYLGDRFNLDELLNLINKKKYFILHAPRQTGKTSAVSEFIDYLNEQGKYKALYLNVEVAQVARGNPKEAMVAILSQFKSNIIRQFGLDDCAIKYLNNLSNDTIAPLTALLEFLEFWAQNNEKPLVIFIDEIDTLIGDSLISVLRQLRTGYKNRPKYFPQSVCLVGVRDVRDYKIWSELEQSMVLGGSAFNIKAESLRLADFTKKQVRDLYLQHTQETGQKFDDDAIEYAFYLTQGQPWLVNALAYQACFRDVKDGSKNITKEIIEKAKDALTLRRDTHIDVLVDRLHEPRVRRIVDSILAGYETETILKIDDLQYSRDLGLIKQKGLEIANPIYQEIIPRELVYAKQESLAQQTIWYQNSDGSIDFSKLLDAFTQFYRENSEIWLEKFDYKESGPHLLLMAFLQRIINGGGKIHREYALGRKRVDLHILWQNQSIVIELKLLRGKKTEEDGLRQTAEYMDINNATEGYLVIFDRDENKAWEDKIFNKKENINGKDIAVWGM